MAQRTRIQVEKIGFLDLFDDIPIPITKALSDIKDLTTRSGGFSTTIEIPGTKNNINILGNLNNLDITNGTFDLKRKYKCVILQGDISRFYGVIKLLGINKYDGPTGEDILTFTIQLYDELSNFYGLIRDKTIDQLFFDDIKIGNWNYNNIVSTFYNNIEDKFKFILPTQTRGYYEIPDFKPAIFTYEYMDRIISSAGYKWNGSKTLTHIATNVRFISIDHYDILMDHSYIVADGYKVGDTIVVGDLYRGKIVTVSAGGFTLDKDTGVITTDVLYSVSISRDEFIDNNMWNLLNKAINLDKLIVPYAGSKDISQDLTNYNTYLGLDLVYFNDYKGWLFDNSTAILTIFWASLTERVNNVGDIIKLKYSGDYVYFEVITKHNDGATSGIWTYTVKSVDPTWNYITNIANASNLDSIYVYRGLKYPLCGNWTGPYSNTSGTSGTNYPNSFNSNLFPIWFNNDNYPYYDKQDSYIVEILSSGGIYFPIGKYFCKKTSTLNINITQKLDIYGLSNYKCWLASNNVNKYSYIVLGYRVYINGNYVENYSKNLKISGSNGDISSAEIKLPILGTEDKNDPNAIILDNNKKWLFIDQKISQSISIPVVKDDIVEVKLSLNLWREETSNPYPKYTQFLNFVSEENNINIELGVRPKEDSTIKFELTGNYQEDDDLMIKDFIPKKTKQSDFLLGLCRLFNLFIDYDDIKKQLLILPKDEYYDLGKKVNNVKIDVSNSGTEIKFLPDLVSKNFIMTYKADNDLISKNYIDNVKENYGQITITYEDQHLYGTTTQESIFYSTPISRSGGNLNIYDGDPNNPTNISGTLRISKKDGNLISYIDYSQTTNIKILYDNKIIYDNTAKPFLVRIKRPKNTLYDLNSINGQEQSYVFTQTISADIPNAKPIYYIGWTYYTNKDINGRYGYPYVGHFYPNPITPSIDLNYAICDYYAYPEIIANVNNNLFYRHYQRTIRQINEGKLLTCKLILKDITILDFKNTYFIMNKYWYLNKIKSYDANSGDIIECEFINVI